MARPDKQGLDYYPKDIDADRDDKLCMIIAEFGCKGEMLFDKLCGWIYKHKGYFIEWNEEEQLKFLSRYNYCGFSVSFINEVVPRFIKWGLFDKAVFDAHKILTSIRIQKTWVDASRKRTGRKIFKNLWLIDISGGLEAEEIEKKAEETTQSKVKKSKVKKNESREPPDGDTHSSEEEELFKQFNEWILKYCPRVAQMKKPITISEYFKLKQTIPKDLLTKLLNAMENRADLHKKYVSAYLTIINWSKNEFNNSGNGPTQSEKPSINDALKNAGKAQAAT